MKKDIVIKIHGCQYVDGEKGITDMTTVGKLEYLDDGYVLRYLESEGNGLEGCQMELRVDNDDRVMLTRTGEFNSQMILENGVRNLCHYETPYGGVLFGIFADTVRADKKGHSGKIKLSYTIDINNDIASKNEIDIKFRESGQ